MVALSGRPEPAVTMLENFQWLTSAFSDRLVELKLLGSATHAATKRFR